jgi:hypothetical protein
MCDRSPPLLHTRGDEKVPDCQFEMAPAMYFNEGLSPPTDHAFSMTTTLLKPTSRALADRNNGIRCYHCARSG